MQLSYWKDGFGSGKCKANRNGVTIKSMTAGVPQKSINATHNTFPIAFGLKSAPGWSKVDKLYQQELKEMSNAVHPEVFYDSAVQRTVAVVCERFVVIEDKVERPEDTGTLSHGGDTHRRFGFAGKITCPPLKPSALFQFLKSNEKGKKKAHWGWCDDFIVGNVNGAKLPSCRTCREVGIEKILALNGLLALDSPRHKEPSSPCLCCANWDLRNKMDLMSFSAHKLSLIHISEPTRPERISYAVFCLKKKKK